MNDRNCLTNNCVRKSSKTFEHDIHSILKSTLSILKGLTFVKLLAPSDLYGNARRFVNAFGAARFKFLILGRQAETLCRTN